MKLKDCLELELDERSQVDNVINFFMDNSKKFLDDDNFYKLSEPSTLPSSSSNQSGSNT